MFEYLTSLDVSDNELTLWPCSDVHDSRSRSKQASTVNCLKYAYPDLIMLNISFNHLHNIQNIASLRSLMELNLSHNNIEE